MANAAQFHSRQFRGIGMSVPVVKGWCPGAHHPMMSGDGLVVRVRPFRSELSAKQILGLCQIAEEFGNGVLDLTSRANLQIRGVSERAHPQVLSRLDMLGLIDPDPAIESKRNILMPDTWQAGDLADRLYEALLDNLPALPDLPEKMGFALDTAASERLQSGSADFRFELDHHDQLLLRADGCATGRAVSEDNAMNALHEMADWFLSTGGREAGRMRRHLEQQELPSTWTGVCPRMETGDKTIGPVANGTILGAPFGKLRAADLHSLMEKIGATHIRLMLNRMFFLKGASLRRAEGFLTEPSPLMQVHACPGAPFCPQATVATMELAQSLAERMEKTLHVSGCAKGCAHPRQAAVTLVGRNGQFDLVLNGRPWDEPRQRGITASELTQKADLI